MLLRLLAGPIRSGASERRAARALRSAIGFG
jgi:hypothetical protein